MNLTRGLSSWGPSVADLYLRRDIGKPRFYSSLLKLSLSPVRGPGDRTDLIRPRSFGRERKGRPPRGKLETFPAGGGAGRRGAVCHAAPIPFAHIMCCVRETATEHNPAPLFVGGPPRTSGMQLGPMQKLPR